MIKALSFDQIQPFIRHIHLQRIEPDFYPMPVKAYDHRIIYIYDGKGYILVNGIKYQAIKGNLLFWQPGIEYLIQSDPADLLVIIGVNFDFTLDQRDSDYPIPPEKSQQFKNEGIIEIIEFTDIDAFNKVIYLKNLNYLDKVLFEIKDEYAAKKKYCYHKINGMFLSLLGDIARYVSSPGSLTGENTNTVDQILKYIHDRYEQQITNKVIGQTFNFHANYINKLMVRHTGTSLHQYLINYRISRAVHLILTSGRSTSEIAYMVGFKDINYFSKAFKSKTGESPKVFKLRSRGPV